ncbi:MAG: NlpC/P60 family protein, partial [Burkholderiales bacterium]
MNPSIERPPSRAAIVALARAWIGTPYHHQASRIGAGVDCIGLVRGVWREIYGREPEALPGYGRDWAEASGTETLIEAARRNLVEIGIADLKPGDVVVFRYRPGVIAKHTGILARTSQENDFTLIHAVERVPVAEVPLSPW